MALGKHLLVGKRPIVDEYFSASPETSAHFRHIVSSIAKWPNGNSSR